MRVRALAIAGTIALAAGAARAQSSSSSDSPDTTTFFAHGVDIHGFVSAGAFVSTANDYIGTSSRGSLQLFEAGINFSTEIVDRLRVGLQLYGRDEGTFKDLPPRLDWAFLDYRWKPWLGLRAGITKMPYGLYNEYEDADASRLSILLPQSVYPLRNRSALISQIGFDLYGNVGIGPAGELEYQAWLGTLDIPSNALILAGATLDSIDTKYVTGVQVFWHPPVDGLRVGGTFVRTSIDFNLTLDAANINALIMAGLEPPSYTGALVVSQRPGVIWIGSIEYVRGDWLFAGEYARWNTHQETSIPAAIPTVDNDNERFYVMATRRLSRRFEVGGYYSHLYLDPADRGGTNAMKFPQSFYAWQRDLAATVRLDINDHWLWKLEGHFIDGTADLDTTTMNAMPTRYWGLFLVKTTVTF